MAATGTNGQVDRGPGTKGQEQAPEGTSDSPLKQGRQCAGMSVTTNFLRQINKCLPTSGFLNANAPTMARFKLST